ncbi:MAG: hypothetical protein Kilf2KO_25840 [Rhodospirillales bacterium]
MGTIIAKEGNCGRVSLWRRPVVWLTSLADLLLTWQARDAERMHLSQLDQRSLEDMGLTKADVQYEVEKPFWQG